MTWQKATKALSRSDPELGMAGMQLISYARHRFPPEVIRHAIWLYLRFTLGIVTLSD